MVRNGGDLQVPPDGGYPRRNTTGTAGHRERDTHDNFNVLMNGRDLCGLGDLKCEVYYLFKHFINWPINRNHRIWAKESFARNSAVFERLTDWKWTI